MKYPCLVVLGILVLSVWFIPPTSANNQQVSSRHFIVYPIGKVDKQGGRTTIIVDRKYQPGLLGLERFSHVLVFYWFDRNDTPQKRSILQVHPHGKKQNPLKGVFATRAPVRPNLIALSLCRIISIRENVIEIDQIDAFPNSPVLDLKPYFPSVDAANATWPEWVDRKQ
ncbi:MAG: tRNA (N6-threonylcarbamoyladenosine(37)-N6)-methyltransferase TrmO [Deltaproteobacteria bacterium]|nr:tRNA (N6-threonylcarbamoyladenosine(37)-N6)-methyltransferase TrmO [Deltaproteobacteria bacterium]